MPLAHYSDGPFHGEDWRQISTLYSSTKAPLINITMIKLGSVMTRRVGDKCDLQTLRNMDIFTTPRI